MKKSLIVLFVQLKKHLSLQLSQASVSFIRLWMPHATKILAPRMFLTMELPKFQLLRKEVVIIVFERLPRFNFDEDIL